jgi:exoribonuclease-2
LLTETNREVKLSTSRLLHTDKVRLDLSMSRDRMVDVLKEVANKRKALISRVDIKDLWEVLNSEQEWIDLATMTAFCFPDSPCGDHESAVLRAFFNDRLYFKFNLDRFFPHSAEQVQRLVAQREAEARKHRIIESGGAWLKRVLTAAASPADASAAEAEEFLGILKSFYLFDKESKDYSLAAAMTAHAGLVDKESLFPILVKLKVFDDDENIDLIRLEVPIEFADEILKRADDIVNSSHGFCSDHGRRDLTALPLMTIDGQSTLDFDDALSLEKIGEQYRLGIHIVDVGHFVPKGDVIDQSAIARGSSIYMPDQKISMLPANLAEGLCSLKAGKIRPAISTMVMLSPSLDMIDYEIFASMVTVQQQLTYYDANLAVDQNQDMMILRAIAEKFRQRRFDAGAVQISVPEINIWLAEDRTITVTRINRESPGRMLVAENMILANWLMARLLSEHQMPAIYRSQPEPRERLYKGDEGTLFQNWMQRRLLSRFILSPQAEKHSGLGLEAYVTATSPIRKYFDLITQRQIRALLGLERPYSAEEIERMIQMLEQPMAKVNRVQYNRHRYWLLKYLEKRIGQKEEAIVLAKRKREYQILLSEYTLECDIPIQSGLDLKLEDLIQVTIQRVNARKDCIQVAIG